MYTPAAMASDLVTLFQALGDRTRLRLLNLLAGGELCVCYFVALLGAAQPKISRHLAYLRRIRRATAVLLLRITPRDQQRGVTAAGKTMPDSGFSQAQERIPGERAESTT